MTKKREKFGGLPPRRPSGPWSEKRRAWELRVMKEEALEGQASQALTEHQAAQAVFDLFEQTKTGRFRLAEIDATELDALASLIEAELQDRSRRESLPA